MQILKNNSEGSDPKLDTVPESLTPQEQIDFGVNASQEGFLVVLGTNLQPQVRSDPVPVYNLFAYNGVLVEQNLVSPPPANAKKT